MLGVYLAKLPEHGGAVVAATTLGLLARDVLPVASSSCRRSSASCRIGIGHHRVMLFGPIFGAVAVILTGLTTNLVVLGGTRILEGASTAASVPSILGYIALATAGNEVLRGKAAARFEGATLAGIGVGFAVAAAAVRRARPDRVLPRTRSSTASRSSIYRFGVEDRDAEERAGRGGSRRRTDGDGPRPLPSIAPRTSHVWLLAPTWIAVNASIGVWFSQSIFQFSEAEPALPRPVPACGASRRSRSRSRPSRSGSCSAPA